MQKNMVKYKDFDKKVNCCLFLWFCAAVFTSLWFFGIIDPRTETVTYYETSTIKVNTPYTKIVDSKNDYRGYLGMYPNYFVEKENKINLKGIDIDTLNYSCTKEVEIADDSRQCNTCGVHLVAFSGRNGACAITYQRKVNERRYFND